MTNSMKNTLLYGALLPIVICGAGLLAGAGAFSFLTALAVNFTACKIIQGRKAKEAAMMVRS